MAIGLLRRVLFSGILASALFSPDARAQEELKLGAIGPLSGGGTAWGLALNRGVQMAVDEVNAAGGLKVGDKTYKVRLIMLDDTYTSTGGRTAADRLINLEKVKFIVGPVGSPAALGALSATGPAGVLLVSNGFNTAILKNEQKAPFNFRVIDTTIEFGPAMVAWMHKAHPEVKKVGLLSPNDATGQAVIPILKAAYEANGFEVWTEVFDRGLQEFTPLLTRMISQGVDLFDINSNSPGDAGLMIKQARQAGYKGLIWQVGGPAVDEMISVLGPLSEGFLSLNMFDFNDPVGQKFAETYHAKWSGIINAQAPLWYNAGRITLEAIRRGGSLEVPPVRDALEKMAGFDAGIISPVAWGGMADYGVAHQLLVPFWIVEVKNGKETVLAKMNPEQR